MGEKHPEAAGKTRAPASASAARTAGRHSSGQVEAPGASMSFPSLPWAQVDARPSQAAAGQAGGTGRPTLV